MGLNRNGQDQGKAQACPPRPLAARRQAAVEAAAAPAQRSKASKPPNGSKRRFLKTSREGPGSARCFTG
jgi:hypothetical protein